METTLLRMLRAAERTRQMDEDLVKHGYSNSPYADIFGDIADAIYYLIGEQKNRFEDSMTYIMLHTDAITDECKVSLLMNEYRKNRPALV